MNRTRLSLLRSSVFAVIVAALAAFAISRGAEPTTTATLAILVVALFGGVEAREIVALRQAVFGGGRDEFDDDDAGEDASERRPPNAERGPPRDRSATDE